MDSNHYYSILKRSCFKRTPNFSIGENKCASTKLFHVCGINLLFDRLEYAGSTTIGVVTSWDDKKNPYKVNQYEDISTESNAKKSSLYVLDNMYVSNIFDIEDWADCHVSRWDDSNNVWSKLVKEDGRFLKYTPKKYITYDLCKSAVIQNGKALEYVPKEYKNKEMCNFSINGHGDALPFILDHIKDDEFYDNVVKICSGHALKYFPKKYQSIARLKLAIGKDGIAIKYVHKSLITEEFCLLAVTNDGSSWNDLPEKFKTVQLGVIAAHDAPFLLRSARYFKNNEVFNEVKNHVMKREMTRFINKEAKFCDISLAFRSNEMCLLAVMLDGMNAFYLLDDQFDDNITMASVIQNGLALQYIPPKFINKKVCLTAVKQNGLALRFVPLPFRDMDMCAEAVRQNVNAKSFVPSEIKVASSVILSQ